MPSWPTANSMPQKWPLGVVEATTDGRIRTEMDAGPAKMRRRFTVEVHTFQFPDGTFILNGQQRSDLIAWYDAADPGGDPGGIGGGVLPFTWDDARFSGDTLTLRFVSRPTFRAIVPDAAEASQLFSVSVELETVPT